MSRVPKREYNSPRVAEIVLAAPAREWVVELSYEVINLGRANCKEFADWDI